MLYTAVWHGMAWHACACAVKVEPGPDFFWGNSFSPPPWTPFARTLQLTRREGIRNARAALRHNGGHVGRRGPRPGWANLGRPDLR